MNIQRLWSMPNSKTFKIKPIRDLILKYSKSSMVILDPFANEHSIKEYLKDCEYISNDIDPSYNCDYNMDALDFLNLFNDNSVDIVLYDPPYTPRQVKEVYTKLDKTVTSSDTQASYWSNFKKAIARVVKPGGIVITCGWNSNGIGKVNGFEIIEILLVAHGGNKNDTIVTVERKIKHNIIC